MNMSEVKNDDEILSVSKLKKSFGSNTVLSEVDLKLKKGETLSLIHISIKYKNENEILQGHEDPEEYYIKRIMPDKIEMNLEYLKDRSFFKDIKVILQTFFAILT